MNKNKLIKFIEKYSVVICTITVIIVLGIVIYIERDEFPLSGRSPGGVMDIVTTSTLDVTDNTNLILVSGPATLHSVAIGQSGSQVALFDSLTSANNDSIIFFATGSAAQVWQLDLEIVTGILVNTTDQSRVRLFYTPK